ncbi:DNA repair protein RadA [Acidithiobacillus thiooxidans]|uniref:DNA repair protein RadA n=1 Tax=Acidithiobacillus thiooxidans TaxID=930 RepID=A0A1C2IQS1_ACITH|nr:DNA repair protein RadA [Acidithiobacillus thiooxidans]OCX74304.1 DNA repair protein RadA [Acidithiobacillus thiooxidans]OCX78381.1 DNA repair protein RadA [Acidithiobacillus thiooxidans]OCX84565.1 DNA repair protein RadA [Acidithiobacillus thiooxidans]OCX89134.1 DNA repair protein RadA [Acidithiobacillus thiooxidans]OFC40726.1 DNA repair protein RadA [Acidithiobacillus thiooxidans]
MSRDKNVFVCQYCGSSSSKWLGRCPDCGAWNSFVEQRVEKSSARSQTAFANASPPQFLHAVPLEDAGRRTTGLSELDRVLGGGQVPGAAILLGGEPGIGKSTLLLQTAHHLSLRSKVLYVTGEESAAQVAMRAQRLSLGKSPVRVLAENHLEAIEVLLQAEKPDLLLIDSIQTVYTDSLQSAPGSVAQVRECAARLVRFAKASTTTVWLVGHVTKEGAIAGPRVLEHMVDTVLYFEGEAGSPYRIVRAIKNRFGAANELGVFQMQEAGLSEVANPSQLFLSQHEKPVPGSVVLATQEGTRPLLVEVQALVTPSPLANPRRVAIGLDPNRLSLLLAILHRHGDSMFFDQDVFVNIAGGIRVNEPAADLAVALALLSSFRNKALTGRRVVFGELGLAGEVRPVADAQGRIREAVKLGFKGAITPRGDQLQAPGTFQITSVLRLGDAMDDAFSGS